MVIITPTRDHPLPDETAQWHLNSLARDLPGMLAAVSGRDRGDGFDIIAQQLDAVRTHHRRQQRLERDIALLRALMFRRDLAVVQQDNPTTAEMIAVRLAAANTDNWYGFRFELNVAATLTLKEIAYSYTDEREGLPDLTARGTDGPIGIECTSTRLTANRDGPVGWKVGAAAGSKTDKDYAGPSTALFIDVTGLVSIPGHGPTELSLNDLREQFSSYVDRSSYGSFVVTSTSVELDWEPLAIGNRYFRVDGDEQTSPLKRFMDQHFPFADTATSTPQFAIGFP